MITQKDIHNILIKTSSECKAEFLKQFDYDVEKIKQFETMMANTCNASADMISEALVYMNKEI